jgi:hypothetical protein
MRPRFVLGLLAGLQAAAVVGCASAVEPVARAETPAPASREVPMNPTLESITTAVLEDAARRIGAGQADLSVESAVAVTWADGSLGCPQPGMNYTMALVPGYRIRVRAGVQLLDYHASRRGYFVLCPPGMAEEPTGNDVR